MVGLKKHPDFCVYNGTKLGQKLYRIVQILYYACGYIFFCLVLFLKITKLKLKKLKPFKLTGFI